MFPPVGDQPLPSVAAPAPVPLQFFFVWFGRTLPLFAELAIQSVLLHHPKARVTLWATAELETTCRSRLQADARVAVCDIDIDVLLTQAGEAVPGGEALDVARLREIWDTLSAPAARANLVRLLVLWTQGGVYLDTDTFTLQPLYPLLPSGGFCGLEHLLWPKARLRKASWYFWLEGPLLMLARALFSKLPYGFRLQQSLLPRYAVAANNAVLGFAPRHPFIARALSRIARLEREEWSKRFRLGTHLLQETLDATANDPAVAVARLSPQHFYPLGPVISSHYFRDYPNIEEVRAQVFSEHTFVIHWYASVSDLQALDAAYIRSHRGRSLYATLMAPLLERIV
jgi:Glycosyltransferase sugar-binding region containing DXD motif